MCCVYMRVARPSLSANHDSAVGNIGDAIGQNAVLHHMLASHMCNVMVLALYACLQTSNTVEQINLLYISLSHLTPLAR